MALIYVAVKAPGSTVSTEMEDFEFAALNTGDEIFLQIMEKAAILSQKSVVKGAGGSTMYRLNVRYPLSTP
ncbi:hypothetical protein [Pseudomonas viridiflava]|uniref:hypothetical protein n=1 Tax=Pseudomonas viridiflava TaxID=33069 RepID=UPI000F05C0FD|nr:hypothetical protein [Pseudomonas viridiflava]